MIAYFKCLCQSKDRLLAQKLKDQGAEVIIVKGNSQLIATAQQYCLKLPFMVKDDGKAESL